MTKRILITGAAAGLGREVSLQLATKGYQLALVDLNHDTLEALQSQLRSTYPDLKVVVEALDITDYGQVGQVFDKLAEQLGGLDIVFANAGVALGSDIGDADNFAGVRKTIEVNLLGTIACIDKAVSIFRRQGHGHIAVTSSLSAIRGTAGDGYGGYSASKSGVNRYMESLYAELLRDGLHKTITTGVLMPGHVATDMVMESDPFVVPLPTAARAIIKAIESRRRNVVISGLAWNIIRWLIPIIPTRFLLPKK